ncbi:CPA1 family monovalent cation:H+ antiporter [Algoriphagus sp. 4150]|uniref:Na+/H+ antiporter n=1 Tax=Algoriphagus sp. 4150 TaxID=2817756 RepID=UPI00285E51F7|nr:Na+/H+ antiporter [Algoriphagus sp. 4150]MDR7131976.1 CPA1 family monovalent cation:H+ antiporter [Algoriphagus sp. 4150]
MVHDYLLLTVGLLLAVLLLVMVGQKLKISYPIFLVTAGLLLSFIPGMPHIRIDPNLVFLIFLPPILYEAAWYTSWHDFWRWKRPISLLAFGLVFFTSIVVAYFSVAFIPGFTLALGFLLGGIISPPDAVAATSVLKGVKIPKRLLTILEGESLVNDASSLIVVKFALAAILTGHFSLQEAVGDFFLLAGMGIVVGLLIAVVVYAIHKYLPTTPSIDTAMTLLTPYLMYVGAEHFHFSGVMAVVSGGLFLSYRSHRMLTHQSRLQATSVWHTLIFLINGTVFILIGLELPIILEDLENVSKTEVILHGLAISLLIIGLRFVWTYISAHLPRLLFKSIRETEKSPGWKGPFIISFAAMRGVVSLAAVFSIPLLLTNGESFPQRSVMLLITFVVIMITLVGQGLLLPFVVKWLNMKEIDGVASDEEQLAGIQLQLNKTTLNYLSKKSQDQLVENRLLTNYKASLENEISNLEEKVSSLEYDEIENNDIILFHQELHNIFTIQRNELARLRKEKLFSDEILRKQGEKIDLSEAQIT